MGKLRFGIATSYMPDPMLGGFLTSAMILVIISQLKVVLGLKITKQVQPFKCVKVSYMYLHSLRLLKLLICISRFSFHALCLKTATQLFSLMCLKQFVNPMKTALVLCAIGTSFVYLELTRKRVVF